MEFMHEFINDIAFYV